MKSEYTMIELTHKLAPDVPTWNGSCGFCLDIKKDYDQTFRVQQIKMHAGAGTHMDAPAHRFKGGCCIAGIPLEQLIVPVCVIDVSKDAHADYEMPLAEIDRYENIYGPIGPGSLVLVYTGWSRFWSNPDVYRGEDEKGQMHFPAISKAAAKRLLERDVVGVAIDTLSPDCLDNDFPVHQVLLGHGKYIIENVADCSEMPPSGGYCLALPIRAEGATEAPIRMVGFAPR